MNEFSSLTSSLAVSPPVSSNGPHPTAKIPPVLQLFVTPSKQSGPFFSFGYCFPY